MHTSTQHVYKYRAFRIGPDGSLRSPVWSGFTLSGKIFFSLLGQNSYQSVNSDSRPMLDNETVYRTHRKKRTWSFHKSLARTPTSKRYTKEQRLVSSSAGLYCWNTLEDAIKYLMMEDGQNYIIFAKVRVWGMGVEGDNGICRYENLEIVELYHPGNANNRRAIAHMIGWPFKIHPTEKERNRGANRKARANP